MNEQCISKVATCDIVKRIPIDTCIAGLLLGATTEIR